MILKIVKYIMQVRHVCQEIIQNWSIMYSFSNRDDSKIMQGRSVYAGVGGTNQYLPFYKSNLIQTFSGNSQVNDTLRTVYSFLLRAMQQRTPRTQKHSSVIILGINLS